MSSSQPSWVSTHKARVKRKQLAAFGKMRTTRSPAQLLVEPLEHVGALQALVMLAWQAVEGLRAADVLFHPVGELRILALPTREPSGEIVLRLGQVAPRIEPAQLLQAIVVSFARQVGPGPYYRRERPIGRNPRGYWLPDQGSNLGPAD